MTAHLNYQIPTINEAASTWGSKVEDALAKIDDASFVSAKAYGATGDGTTNDYAPLAAMVAAASANERFVFPDGTYLVDGPTNEGLVIDSKDGLTFWGPGATIKRGTSRVDNRCVTVTNCDGMRWSEVSFDLNGVTQYGSALNFDGCARTRVNECRVYDSNFTASAFDHYAFVAQNSTDVRCEGNWIERSKIEVNRNVGVAIVGNTFHLSEGSQDIAIAGNDPGAVLSDYLIAHNRFFDPEGVAIQVSAEGTTGSREFRRVHIFDNQVFCQTRGGQSAIAVTIAASGLTVTMDDVRVERNTVYYASGVAPSDSAIKMYTQSITTQPMRNVTCKDNHVIGFSHATAYAIDTQFFLTGELSENRVTQGPDGTATNAIRANNFSRSTFARNVAYATSVAFSFGASEGNNTVRDNESLSGDYSYTAASSDFCQKRRLTKAAAIAGSSFGSIGAGAWQEADVAFTSVTAADSVTITPNATPGSGIMWTAFPKAGAVTVRLANHHTTAVTPSDRTWRIVIEQWA